MNDSLSEMQSFEVEPIKKVEIDFTQQPYEIHKSILRLPLAEQQYWIDIWMEQPGIKADRERRERDRKESEIVHPAPINTGKKTSSDNQWQD